LDNELRYYRLAGKEKRPTPELLRRVRQVLGLPAAEVARALGVNRSVLFRLEGSEARGTISLRAMSRVAQALDCKVVYALVPNDGTTLEETADRRKWKKRLGVE
jgi:transcriptional regulator with XRE-family HTH domain